MNVHRHPLLGILTAAIALSAALPRPAAAWEGLAPYAEESDILATSPSTEDGAIAAMFNPAQWGILDQGEFSFFWSDENARPNKMDNWGFAMGQALGLTLRRHDERVPGGARDVTDWQIGTGGGLGAYYTGLAFGFSGPGKGAFGRDNFIGLGSISRPARWISYGSSVRFALSGGDIDGIVDLGIRPLGDPRLLLFADYSLSRGDRWDDGPLAGGVAIRPVPGLQAAARWGDEDQLQVTLGLTLQRTGFRATPRYDAEGNKGATRYAARFNPPERGIDLDARANRGRRFVDLDLKGRAVYRTFRYGDKGKIALRPLLASMQEAIDDPTVGGFVVSLSGFEANPAVLWEIREKLVRARERGKRVIVYADRLTVGGYYLASAADRIVMDPMGMVVIPGIQISRTYLKGTLDKLGLGFDEWRYYKYKSALETFSRTSMSAADKEQLQALTDAGYGEVQSGVAQTRRSLTKDRFDRVVNEEPVLTPRRLLELGWIDAIARPETLKAVARSVGHPKARLVSPGALHRLRWQPVEEWGPEPTVAVVYAIGPCAMDEGIKGRETAKQLRKYRKDRDVKAVVLRADSPGGDPLPSDLVAGELRELRRAGKPVLVSQGRVAASGGYWISMDADSILTTPFTVTGSIGVIGGWVWNKGFGKKTGFTSDHVQRGKSADLFGGIRLPLLEVNLPERNLDAAERKQVERLFAELYGDFVSKVASTRGLPETRVREIAEGRVYLGRDAVRLDLVDRVGGLDDAIESARLAAGIRSKRKMRIEEYPKPGFLRLPPFVPSVFGPARFPEGADPLSYEARVLQEVLNHPGQPLLLAPGEILPAETEATR